MEQLFTELKSYQRLLYLAKNPPDLTDGNIFNKDRIQHFISEGCGYKFLYATERVSQEIMEALVDLAKESQALDKMKKMQNGEIVNFIKGYKSENRAALHTATRDFFDHPINALSAKEASEMALEQVEKLKSFIQDNEVSEKFTDLIVIGIGGSDLGPYANFLALEYLMKKNRRLYFINNIDPDNAASVIKDVHLEKTLVAVISKSGNTLETSVNAEFIRKYFIESGLKPEKHFISITGEGSPMDNPRHSLESFYIWDWIGGRYSSTSMVGGLLIAFAFGFDVYLEFLKGANSMDKLAMKEDIQENLPLLGALLGIWNRNFLSYPTLAIIPYSNALRRYPAHIQQLSMESNGKHVNKNGQFIKYETGEVIWGEPGTNAQHSFYQLIHQGSDIIPLEFIGFKDPQYEEDILFEGTTSQEKLLSNLIAQSIGLALGKKNDNPNKEFQGNRPSHIIFGKKLTPFSLGALLAYYEHKVAFQGFIWNINSFDQEGVQLGKILANRIIDRYATQRGLKNAEDYPIADIYIKEFENS